MWGERGGWCGVGGGGGGSGFFVRQMIYWSTEGGGRK